MSAPTTNRALQGAGTARLGSITYRIKSQDRHQVYHTITVDLATLACTCSCEGFRYHRQRASILDPSAAMCKHLRTFQKAILRDVAHAYGSTEALDILAQMG